MRRNIVSNCLANVTAMSFPLRSRSAIICSCFAIWRMSLGKSKTRKLHRAVHNEPFPTNRWGAGIRRGFIRVPNKHSRNSVRPLGPLGDAVWSLDQIGPTILIFINLSRQQTLVSADGMRIASPCKCRRVPWRPLAAPLVFYSVASSRCAHFADGERRFHAMVSRYFARS